MADEAMSNHGVRKCDQSVIDIDFAQPESEWEKTFFKILNKNGCRHLIRDSGRHLGHY